MPTDGPADPNPAGATSGEAEGSIFDRLKSPQTIRGTDRGADVGGSGDTDAEEVADLPDAGAAMASASEGHVPVDSSRQNTAVLAASRDSAGIASAPAGTRAVDLQGPRIEDRDPRAEKRAERLVAFWFTVSTVAVLGFVFTFIAGAPTKRYYNATLGATMGLALLGIGVGAVLWAKKLMPDEEAVQERHDFHSPERDVLAAQEVFRKGVAESGFTTRPLVRRSLLGAASALGLLALVPLRALATPTSSQAADALARTSWKKGLRLIDSVNKTPVRLGDVAIGGLLTVIPAGTEDNLDAQADSVAMLIRLRPGELNPVKGHEGLDFEGHVVYSKLCSHLGCPVSLYEQQTHRLLCPCHQSQFLANESARPVFGPASRRLAQLALGVDSEGYFIARDGDFPEPVGPGYWERSER